MDLIRLEKLGLVEKTIPNEKIIYSNLARARRDLLTSRANLSIDEEWAFTIAYHSMLRAGRALLLAYGYRPKGKDQHKTVVDFSAATFGQELTQLTLRFNRMRMKRHNFIYEPDKPIPRTEAEKSLQSAQSFVDEIAKKIDQRMRSDLGKKDPRKIREKIRLADGYDYKKARLR